MSNLGNYFQMSNNVTEDNKEFIRVAVYNKELDRELYQYQS